MPKDAKIKKESFETKKKERLRFGIFQWTPGFMRSKTYNSEKNEKPQKSEEKKLSDDDAYFKPLLIME